MGSSDSNRSGNGGRWCDVVDRVFLGDPANHAVKAPCGSHRPSCGRGPAGPEHLLVRQQWPKMIEARQPSPNQSELVGEGGAKSSLSDLLDHPASAEVLEDAIGAGAVDRLRGLGTLSLLQASALLPPLTGRKIRELHELQQHAQDRHPVGL